MPAPLFDVLGLGITAVDTLLYVDAYPPADSKVPVRGRARQMGGLTATALVSAARLGGRAAYAGLLGFDPLSEEMLAALHSAGVDVSRVVRQAGAGPIESLIVVDTGRDTRTIFFDSARPHGPGPEPLPDELIRSARVLFVDHHNAPAMLRAAAAARAAGIPVVADFERSERSDEAAFPALLAAADHLIVSRRFAAALTGRSEPGEMTAALWEPGRALVAVTCGAEGAWYRTRADGPALRQPAFAVRAVDPTGCGDVFHGAYALRLAEGAPPAERMRFAAAAAALKATQPGGQGGIPTRAQVEVLLGQASY